MTEPREESNLGEAIYQRVSDVLAQARCQAYRAVNAAMVQAYWEIGRIIVEGEQQGKMRAEYGKHLIKELAVKLSAEFGKGFDHSNLWNMRAFYLSFQKIDAVRRELTWTHYRLLLRVENNKARDFYLDEAIASGWSTRQLERQINSHYYERLLASRDREPVRKEIAELEPPPTPKDVIKDPYVLEFLGLETIRRSGRRTWNRR